MTAYYNEIDPVAAQWLRNLIAADLIAPGEVDERSISDVTPAELMGFTQCHFFAGIGIWSGALRAAGWPDYRPIWTGSCPCQPFSASGNRTGFDDERHLWPHWFQLIAVCGPGVVVGEQVATKDGLGWLDLVQDDLGAADYACGTLDLCAAGFGVGWRGSTYAAWLERAVQHCPDPMAARQLRNFADWADQSLGLGGMHIRQRLYFVGLADSPSEQWRAWRVGSESEEPGQVERPARLRAPVGLGNAGGGGSAPRLSEAMERQEGIAEVADDRGSGLSRSSAGRPEPDGLADAGCGGVQPNDRPGRERGPEGKGKGKARQRKRRGADDPAGRAPSGLPDSDGRDASEGREQPSGEHRQPADHRGGAGPRSDGRGGELASELGANAADGGRTPFDWLFCRDGSWRAVETGTLPLAHAVAGRVGQLRAFGNGLDFETATAFCEAVRELADEAGL